MAFQTASEDKRVVVAWRLVITVLLTTHWRVTLVDNHGLDTLTITVCWCSLRNDYLYCTNHPVESATTGLSFEWYWFSQSDGSPPFSKLLSVKVGFVCRQSLLVRICKWCKVCLVYLDLKSEPQHSHNHWQEPESKNKNKATYMILYLLYLPFVDLIEKPEWWDASCNVQQLETDSFDFLGPYISGYIFRHETTRQGNIAEVKRSKGLIITFMLCQHQFFIYYEFPWPCLFSQPWAQIRVSWWTRQHIHTFVSWFLLSKQVI